MLFFTFLIIASLFVFFNKSSINCYEPALFPTHVVIKLIIYLGRYDDLFSG